MGFNSGFKGLSQSATTKEWMLANS